MNTSLKIAIIGDYNFTYYSHQATNLALDHASLFLEVDVNYYWLKVNEVAQFKASKLEQFDGVWIAPGAINNPFFLHGILKVLKQLSVPTLITGEAFQAMINVLVQESFNRFQNDKFISDNLVEEQTFEKITIVPHSTTFIQLLENHTTYELTSSRYSIYPQILNELIEKFIDIEAYNHFEDPEIFSLKNHPFFLVCGYCPQISSTRELPHPVIYTFLKLCNAKAQGLLA